MATKTWLLTTPVAHTKKNAALAYIRDVKKHAQVAAGFYAEAQSTPDQTIALYAGVAYFGTNKVEYEGLDVADLGTAGAFETTALTADFYNKILFTIDSSGTVEIVEGAEDAVLGSVVEPSIPVSKFPICMVTIQDDGNAGAGTILTIEQSEIKQIQNLATVNESSLATVASHATTSAIWAAAGNIINFTGAETITDFPAADQAGPQRILICAGAVVFTHAGSITVQGSATRTSVAGDVVTITATTTTTFHVNFIAHAETGTGSTVRATSPTIATPEVTGLLTLTGGQIAFPASAVPSGDPNTLDDYEEGKYETVETMDGGGTVTLNATNRYLHYTKNGRDVHINGKIQVTEVDNPLGAARIAIPFTSSGDSSCESGGAIGCEGVNFSTGVYLWFHIRADLDYGILKTSSDELIGGIIPADGDEYYFDNSYKT